MTEHNEARVGPGGFIAQRWPKALNGKHWAMISVDAIGDAMFTVLSDEDVKDWPGLHVIPPPKPSDRDEIALVRAYANAPWGETPFPIHHLQLFITWYDYLRGEVDRLRVESRQLRTWALQYREALHSLSEDDCCEYHSRDCEPPSELCCQDCSEATHPDHGDGSTCTVPDLSPAVLVMPEGGESRG